jgi:hypothetical protein
MKASDKFSRLLNANRQPRELEDWVFSVAALGLSFFFYLILVLSSGLESRGLLIAYGAAAAFIGLQSYWIIRGWQKNNLITILLGIAGMLVVLAALWLYLLFH